MALFYLTLGVLLEPLYKIHLTMLEKNGSLH